MSIARRVAEEQCPSGAQGRGIDVAREIASEQVRYWRLYMSAADAAPMVGFRRRMTEWRVIEYRLARMWLKLQAN